jgi:hypothetical protein
MKLSKEHAVARAWVHAQGRINGDNLAAAYAVLQLVADVTHAKGEVTLRTLRLLLSHKAGRIAETLLIGEPPSSLRDLIPGERKRGVAGPALSFGVPIPEHELTEHLDEPLVLTKNGRVVLDACELLIGCTQAADSKDPTVEGWDKDSVSP